jgi:hypothetical protein
MLGATMKRSPSVLIVCAAISLALTGCGAAVAPTSEPAAPAVESCEAVRARCGAAPMRLVRATAQGLTGLDGARVRFAVRYITETGVGLEGPRGVALGGGTVAGGAVEACLCVPAGANNYPQVSAVIFAPGARTERPEDVRRAHFSQRFATTDEENFTHELSMPPTGSQVSAALASLVERTLRLELRGVDRRFDGRALFGAVIADERPLPSDRAQGTVADGAVALQWAMPGAPSASERLLLVIDANGDRRCGEGDQSATVPVSPGASQLALDGARWSAAPDAVRAACAALDVPGA